jgi:centromeric protein E
VLGPSAGQKDVFDLVAKGIVRSVVNGYNGTIFAYGQTAAGKTFTMQGNGAHPGVLPQAIQEITNAIAEVRACESVSLMPGGRWFSGIRIAEHCVVRCTLLMTVQSPNRVFGIRVSYLEIYNETIRDLLAEGAPTVAVHEDKKRVRWGEPGLLLLRPITLCSRCSAAGWRHVAQSQIHTAPPPSRPSVSAGHLRGRR